MTDSVVYRAFTVTRDGIYFIRPGQKDRPNELRLLDPSTLTSRVLSLLDRSRGEGLTVSPDGKTILYSRWKESNADLMLVENFR